MKRRTNPIVDENWILSKSEEELRKTQCLICDKTRLYGGGVWLPFGYEGLYYELSRKYFRLENIINKGQDGGHDCGDSMEDTLRDMAVFCIFGLMEIQRRKDEHQGGTQ